MNLPKIMHPKSDRFADRAIAGCVNIVALPFFAVGALLVFGIAMLMRFGGRPMRN